jgi:ribulose-phosphate 3-epimerase
MNGRKPPALAPSILAADFTRLGAELASIETSGLADRVHVDMMDGQFVPPISFGTIVCEAARRATRLPLDVHLMVVQPARFFDELVRAGAETITIHVEACPHLHRDLGTIKQLGARAGVALCPGTPLTAIDAVLDLIDLVLLMSVNPGWSGQPFLPTSLHRVEQLVEKLLAQGRRIATPDRRDGGVEIEVDGGVNATTASGLVAAGATVLVTGSAAFGHPDGVVAGLMKIRRAIAAASSPRRARQAALR